MTDRRENGLPADAYTPLITLPPSRADAMLDALRRTGIAAYAVPIDVEQPSNRETDPAQGHPECDRLYVDAREQAEAERVLHAELPDLAGTADGTSVAADRAEGDGTATTDTHPSGGEESGSEESDPDDAVWAELVARFYESDVAAHDAVWPDAENISASGEESPVATDEEDTTPGGADAASDTTSRDTPDSVRAERAADDSGGSDDHFVPPPPPPFPRGDATSRLAWAGLLGGPLLLLGSMLLGQRLPGWLAFCSVAAFIAGFVVLVVRMGDGPSGDNGPDDGAVV